VNLNNTDIIYIIIIRLCFIYCWP